MGTDGAGVLQWDQRAGEAQEGSAGSQQTGAGIPPHSIPSHPRGEGGVGVAVPALSMALVLLVSHTARAWRSSQSHRQRAGNATSSSLGVLTHSLGASACPGGFNLFWGQPWGLHPVLGASPCPGGFTLSWGQPWGFHPALRTGCSPGELYLAPGMLLCVVASTRALGWAWSSLVWGRKEG